MANISTVTNVNPHKFWFNNPEVDIILPCERMQKKIKGMCLSALLNIYKYIEYDQKLSNNLTNSLFYPYESVHVCYVTKRKMKSLIPLINKNCNFAIDLETVCMKITIDNDVFILAISFGKIEKNSERIMYFYHKCDGVQHYFQQTNLSYGYVIDYESSDWFEVYSEMINGEMKELWSVYGIR